MPDPTTRTIDADGAEITYDVLAATEPGDPRILLLIGSPMGAGGFGTLRGHFPDRTVVTYDPRGVERSPKAEPTSQIDPGTARRRPAPGHRGGGRRPGRRLRQQRRRGQRAGPRDRAPGATSRRSSPTSHRWPSSCPTARRPWRPARPFATRTSAAAADRPWPGSSPWSSTRARSPTATPTSPARIRPCSGCRARTTATGPTPWPARTSSPAPTTSPTSTPCAPPRPGSSSPSAPGPGSSSPHEPARVLAERLGTDVVVFPGGHGGFLGGEYGQTGEPDAFAAKLREVLG